MLVGREAETAGLGRLLDAARLGKSGALLVRGQAGIGKTALLEQAAAAATGFHVLRATGIEAEEELPYAMLHQLLRPLEDRIELLAEPQARALRGALGLASERQADPFLVCVGTLTLLADAAEEQPVLALLDHAAWFDRESAHALGFTARRLHAEGVVLLFAVRDEPGRAFSLPGVEELRVERLDDGRSRELLQARYGDGADSSRHDDVIARAAGNPLALLELARDGVSAGGAEQAFASQVQAMPEATQALLLLAAADSTTSLAVVGAAARPAGLDAARRPTWCVASATSSAVDAVHAAFPLLEHAVALADRSDDALTLLHGSWAASFTSDLSHASVLSARGERVARASGALGVLAALLMSRATWELAAARFASAETAASEGLELSRETGQESVAALCLAVLAHVDAVRGREQSCRERAAEAIAWAEAHGHTQPASAAGLALAVLDLGQGRPGEALDRLLAIFADGHMTYRYTVIDDLVEAAVRAGRPDDSLDALTAWQHWARHSRLVVGDVVLARGRAPARRARGRGRPLPRGARAARRHPVAVRPRAHRAGLRRVPAARAAQD